MYDGGVGMEDYIIDVNNVTVRFNKANMKVDNIKEYVVRVLRHVSGIYRIEGHKSSDQKR